MAIAAMKPNFLSSYRFILIVSVLLFFGFGTQSIFAQASPSVLYIPLIGITSVPEPLALPKGPGYVTYNYAVKNFLGEIALTDIQVVDDKCSPVKFLEGDDNRDGKLDYNETWRYSCTTKLFQTTQSVATARGTANNITASHKAYATVIVGSDTPPPLVSIVNITKVAYPYSLPAEGGKITFTYKVNNPGVVPLSDVRVTDDKCSTMSGKLGDRNGNNLLDINEVWIYTCTTTLKQTTTNTAHVSAFANGLIAVGDATITVNVDSLLAQSAPKFPDVGSNPSLPGQEIPSFPLMEGVSSAKITLWAILSDILVALIIIFFFLTRKKKSGKTRGKR